MKSSLSWLFFSLIFLSGCVQLPEKELAVKPDVAITPSEVVDLVQALSNTFPKHSFSTLWEAEMTAGWVFAQEGDFYRAITSFKKALIYLDLSPDAKILPYDTANKLRIEAVTGIISSYVFPKKYEHAIESWDSLSTKINLYQRREARWLLIMMVQALSATKAHEVRAVDVATMLPPDDPYRIQLLAYLALRSQSLKPLAHIQPSQEPSLADQTELLFSNWKTKKKSPSVAFGLNLLLPGSGYAYVHQWPTAFTSFTINALFIGATYEFFKAHQPMAALITLGLELGWWGGGAIGANLSTQEYNHHLWLDMAKRFMREQGLYPEAILWKALQSENSVQ